VIHLRLTHTSEDRHDYFGIVHFDGSGYVKIKKPDKIIKWQTPECSTHPTFATAAGIMPDKTYDLYAIRLSDHRPLRITWDGGYIHAHL